MKKSTLKRILILLKPYSFFLLISIISALITVSTALLSPVLIGDAIDLLNENQVNFDELYIILYKLIACGIVGAIFMYFMHFINNTIIYKLVSKLRKDTFNKLNKLPISYIDSHMHGDIINRIITDIDAITDGLLQAFTELFTGLLTILFTLGFMFMISWKIAIVVTVLTPLSLITSSTIAKMSYKVFKKQAEIKGKISSLMNEMMDNQKVLLCYDYTDINVSLYESLNKELHSVGVKAQFLSSLVNPTTRFVNAIVYASVGVFGGILAVRGNINVGTLYVFLSYASQYTKPFNSISGVVAELQNSLASGRRVFEFLDLDELVYDTNQITDFNASGNVSLKSVDFSYTSNKKIIENFNLDVNKGEMIAIVGPTGCGKTTLINLLMRFYDCDNGSIEFDGKNIKEISRNALRSNIGMVLQDTWLFRGTIYDNIAYGLENPTMEQVVEAAKKSYADSFINRLPNGYNTIISDDSGLSIGEKQLLCISRLMIRIPKILILDEATSNIDTRTEGLVQKAFLNLMKDRTSFVIAHRLQTIKDADKILVMKDGKIIECGKHEELIEKDGFYNSLYNSQFM